MKNKYIKKLPLRIQKTLADFLVEIPKVHYLKPDGNPKKEWKMFYGEDFSTAWDVTKDTTGYSKDAAGVNGRSQKIVTKKLSLVLVKTQEVWQKTEAWRKAGGFRHKKPCQEWLNGKKCSHYTKARYRHFKTDIDSMLQTVFQTVSE